jgi:RHS repeat-associated protein
MSPIDPWPLCAGRVVATIDELANRTTQVYDAASRRTRTVNALGKVNTTIYDAADRSIALVNPLGNRWSSTYDAASRIIRMTNPLGKISTSVYDVADRPVAAINPLGFRTTTTYDAAGQAIRVTDANNKVSTTSYDAAGRVIASIDANANRVTQIYDAASERLALVDARGNRTSFAYDSAGRQIWQMDALARRTTAGYDTASRQISRTDARGNRTTYSFDSANRPTGPRYPDGTRATFVYDSVGRRTMLQDWTGRASSTYDDGGRLRTVTNPAGMRITYSLDAISRRTVMTEPGGGRFSYTYDDADRITKLINTQSQRTSWAYDAANRVTSKRLANTDRASYTYDDADQILRVANVIPGVTTISSFGYKYGSSGNRFRVVEANGDTVTWSYDNAYQLTNEKRSGTNSYNLTYLYDPAGNRLRKNDSGTLTTSTYDAANQLIKQNAAGTMTTYSFDANGNQQRTSSSTVTTYTWDFENRLTKIRPSNLLPAINTMTYDGDGKRVRKDDSGGTVKDIWDAANILLETDQNDVIKVIYTDEPADYGRLISQLRGSTSRFYAYDGLGSTEQLTDSTGQTVTDSYVYRAFGDLQTNSGMTINPFRYVGLQGYYFDPDTGLQYNRARYYDPKTGRWTSQDPVRFTAGDANLYRYVKNVPTLLVDPSGLILPLPLRFHLDYVIDEPITPKLNGGFEYKSHWLLDRETPNGGYIIQVVNYKWKVVDCKTRKELDYTDINIYMLGIQFNAFWYPYLEAWHVSQNRVYTDEYVDAIKKKLNPPFDDMQQAPGFNRAPTEGALAVLLKAKYYDNFTLPKNFAVRNAPPTGLLPAVVPAPNAFLLPGGNSNVVVRAFLITWCSCNGPVKSNVLDLSNLLGSAAIGP